VRALRRVSATGVGKSKVRLLRENCDAAVMHHHFHVTCVTAARVTRLVAKSASCSCRLELQPIPCLAPLPAEELVHAHGSWLLPRLRYSGVCIVRGQRHMGARGSVCTLWRHRVHGSNRGHHAADFSVLAVVCMRTVQACGSVMSRPRCGVVPRLTRCRRGSIHPATRSS